MSLPTGGPWPPHPHEIALTQQSVWDAWLVGDPEGLIMAYSRVDQTGATAEHSFSPRTDGGGLIQRVARYFWSRPAASGQRKARLHVPMAADLATASADLLFSEPPQFRPSEDANEAAGTRIDELLNQGGFHSELIEAAELTAGLGGGWLRLVWDKSVADRVMIDAVAADAGIGEWQWGVLRAVTFFTEYKASSSDQEVIRHLERHEPGAVLHGLYRGDDKSLGHLIPLAEHPSTRDFAIDAQGEPVALEDGAMTLAIETGVPGLTAAYVANMRPQRRWRKLEALANLGRSDYDGVEPLMDALDETYTSWMRDVRLGRSRIIVPEFMLKDLGAGKGAAWDEDQEVFTQLNVAPTDGGSQITPQQFAIRVAEHQQTADAIVDQILDAAGYSPSTFGRGGETVATATEVTSRERKSARTRDKKSRYWTQALEPLLTTWLALDALVFGGGATGAVEVEWSDESQPDAESLSRTIETLNRAVAVSIDTKVRMLHPDWTEEQLTAEIARIQSEQMVPDLGPLPGDLSAV